MTKFIIRANCSTSERYHLLLPNQNLSILGEGQGGHDPKFVYSWCLTQQVWTLTYFFTHQANMPNAAGQLAKGSCPLFDARILATSVLGPTAAEWHGTDSALLFRSRRRMCRTKAINSLGREFLTAATGLFSRSWNCKVEEFSGDAIAIAVGVVLFHIWPPSEPPTLT